MKIKTLLFLFICLSLSACKDDDDPSGNSDRPETQAWIEDTMREHYYWYNEIPAAGKLNYANDPETFFYSLLSLIKTESSWKQTSIFLLHQRTHRRKYT